MTGDRTREPAREQTRRHEPADSPAQQPVAAGPVALQPVPVAGLTVGHADDPAERRADALAETALARLQRLTDPGGAVPELVAVPEERTGPLPVAALRRYAEPPARRRTVDATLAAEAAGGERAARRVAVLRSASPARPPAGAEVGPSGGRLSEATSRSVESLVQTGAPLPAELRSPMEAAFGTDFGSVRLHTGDVSARLNAALHAHAFTVDQTVFYGGPASDLATDHGRHVLGHELAHVVQNRSGSTARATSGRRAIRRFDVRLQFVDDPAIPNARVNGLTFKDRPGDTYIGGDAFGTRRHLVSWALEQQAYQAAVQGRTVRQLADQYGGNGSPATKRSVEDAIKARIAGESAARKVHQGSAEGNQALGQMEQQGKAQLRQPNLSDQERFRAHVMAFLGAIDMPAFSSGNPQQDYGLLHETVLRAANFYVTGNGIPAQNGPFLINAAMAALWNDQAHSYRSGDEISQGFRGHVLAAQYGIPAHAATMVGHFTVGPQQAAPQLTGPQQAQLPWHHQ
jgi:hypothetical protein